MNVNAISIAIQINEPVIVWGDPGIGKSSVVESIAEALGAYCETCIASIRDPADFGGYPAVVGDELCFLPAPFIKRTIKHCDTKKPIGAIFFLDEISTAPPAVQSALLRLVLDRWAGDTKLPSNSAITGAANPPEIAAGGWDLSPPLANRFIHLYAVPDLKKWSAGMLAGFPPPNIKPLPENWEKKIPQERNLIISFLHREQHLFHHKPDGKKDDSPMAYPTPRSWTKYAKISAACGDGFADEETTMDLLAGCVGETGAIAEREYRANLNLPDPEELLKNPKNLIMPDRGDIAFAIINSVAVAILQNNTAPRWEAGWDVIARCVDLGLPDVAVVAAMTLANNQPAGAKPPASAAKLAAIIIKAGLT